MKKPLSTLSLTLIAVGSVDSIRNLPAAALTGSSMLLYFTLALVFFLLPCAIVSIWFAKHSEQGVYGWVELGLGKPLAITAIWFQWLQNIIIYPTFLASLPQRCFIQSNLKLQSIKCYSLDSSIVC